MSSNILDGKNVAGRKDSIKMASRKF